MRKNFAEIKKFFVLTEYYKGHTTEMLILEEAIVNEYRKICFHKFRLVLYIHTLYVERIECV